MADEAKQDEFSEDELASVVENVTEPPVTIIDRTILPTSKSRTQTKPAKTKYEPFRW